jgi:hypothetical protein
MLDRFLLPEGEGIEKSTLPLSQRKREQIRTHLLMLAGMMVMPRRVPTFVAASRAGHNVVSVESAFAVR